MLSEKERDALGDIRDNILRVTRFIEGLDLAGRLWRVRGASIVTITSASWSIESGGRSMKPYRRFVSRSTPNCKTDSRLRQR
jgi:hypothetical protein